MDLTEETTTEATEIGSVLEIMPSAMYRVRLESGRVISASLAPQAKHSIVRLISGSRVFVKVSSFDPTRGQIQGKFK